MSSSRIIKTKHGDCALTFSNTRKTLAISVLPNGKLEVVAPITATESDIISKLEKRAYWIFKQRLYFRNLNTIEKKLRYTSGATHRYLGKQYRLKIELADESLVKLKGGFFHIKVTDLNETVIKKLLVAWYREKALQQFNKRSQKWNEWCKNRDLPQPEIKLRVMQNRWGSAHSNGIIYLNPELIKAPSVCVDYVIIHEICHLKYPNHTMDFYDLLESQCTSWKVIRKRLADF